MRISGLNVEGVRPAPPDGSLDLPSSASFQLAPTVSLLTLWRLCALFADPGELSIAEQVAGRQQRIQFEVQMSSAVVDRFLEYAGNALGNATIRCWLLPVLAAGHLGE